MTHGSRVEISWEMCISRFPSADKTLGGTPAPAPAASGTGPGGAARGTLERLVGVMPVPSCGNWENIRENMLALDWERWLEAHPWEPGEVLGAPLGLHRAPPAAAREPLSLLSVVLTLWEMLLTEALGAGDPRSQILHLVHIFGG